MKAVEVAKAICLFSGKYKINTSGVMPSTQDIGNSAKCRQSQRIGFNRIEFKVVSFVVLHPE
ncbi:MAG: hypothetical protein ACXWTW_09300 [Methylobacter sp.]